MVKNEVKRLFVLIVVIFILIPLFYGCKIKKQGFGKIEISMVQTVPAASAPRPDGIDRSHPLGLKYWDPYGILSTKYETPHVKWGRPLAGGPIKVLVMAPQWSHRETVELAQRLDIHFTPWMCYNTRHFFVDPGDVSWCPPPEFIRNLLSKYLKEDYDVIVIGKIDWSIIPVESRFEILKKVKNGTGFVYICPPEITNELNSVFTRNPNNGSDEILRGVPWQSLPRLRLTDPARLVRTSTFGRGRVVILDYQQRLLRPVKTGIDLDMHSLTPSWGQIPRLEPRDDEVELELGPYEYYQSLAARAIRWAAGRLSNIKLSADFPLSITAGEKIPVSLGMEGTGPIVSLSVVVRAVDGEQVFDCNLKADSSVGKKDIELPKVFAGKYMLDLWARDEKGCVLEWAGFAFEVRYDNKIEKIELINRLLEPGDTVKAKIELAKPLLSNQKLLAELWDLHGRLIAVQELVPSGQVAEVNLGPLAPVHCMHELRITIFQDGIKLAQGRLYFPVRVKFQRDDFASVVWANAITSYDEVSNSLLTFYMLKKLREVDQADVIAMEIFNPLSARWRHYPARGEMEVSHCAKANLMICPNNSSFSTWDLNETHSEKHSSTEWCLADSKFIEKMANYFRNDAKIYAPYGPFVWTHGDEARYSDDPDADWHPAALARFRRLLKEKLYPNLESLNREWGTKYISWDEVMPITLAEAKKTGNFPPFVTHKLSSDVIFSEIYKYTGDVIREIDKGARTGFDGALNQGLWIPNTGYDWWLLTRNNTLLQSYHGGDFQSEIWRSFAPANSSTVRGLWHGTYGGTATERPNTIEYMHYHPWYSLFHHMNTVWFWAMGKPGPLSGYAPDLTSLGFMQSEVNALKEIKSGPGKLILSAARADDGIAIHFSESSRIVDILCGYSERPASPWYSNYTDAIGNVAYSLEDAGFQYRFVAYQEIEEGVLQRRGYKVLFLPYSRAISDKEAEQILAFARAGGVVIADIIPGILTETGAKRPVSILKQLFPKDEPGTITHLDGGVSILIGTDMLKDYYRLHIGTKGWEQLKGRWRKIAELLKMHVGLEPVITIESKTGEMPPTEIARFDADEIELIGLIRPYFLRDNNGYEAQIHFPRKAHLYDVRAGKYLGETDYCDRLLDYQAELLALSPYQVKSVNIKVVEQAILGKSLKLNIVVMSKTGKVMGKHVLRLTVLGPDGKERKWYAQNILAPAGQGTAVIPLALNETSGTYTIRVKDSMSGVAGQTKFVLTKRAAQ